MNKEQKKYLAYVVLFIIGLIILFTLSGCDSNMEFAPEAKKVVDMTQWELILTVFFTVLIANLF